MGKKVYLSPAAHASDNGTKCPDKCGENIHANAYMDIVERRLRQLGFDVKRGDKKLTGSAAMQTRTKEANKWGADIYYVAHTNAGGGRYSVTYCYTDKRSQQIAAVIGKYRKALTAHNGYVWRCKPTGDLYEINQTAMVCLYDELFFHDNAEDCKWFHGGGIKAMAEETVQALCEICGVKYQPEQKQPATTAKPAAPATPKVWKPGDAVNMTNGKLYSSSDGTKYVLRTGKYYIYDGQKINGKYRITNKPERVGKKPAGLYVTGWIVL